MKHIITISETIKQAIAEKVALQASAGYDSDVMGRWYVVDGDDVIHCETHAAWNPWPDDAATINVNDLVNLFGGAEDDLADFENGVDGADDYDLAVEFALGYVPDSYDATEYEERYG